MESWAECVSDPECEEVFLNRSLIVRHDPTHSDEERRLYALGQTQKGRQLFIAFTVRQKRIRIISAREMTRRERRFYTSYEDCKET
jgi:uncharacterized protein